MKDLASALDMLKGYEDNVPYMYLDSRGYVTVGVGFYLASAIDASSYAFYKTNVPAPMPNANTQNRATANPALPGAKSSTTNPVNAAAPPPIAAGPQKATPDEIKAEWTKIKGQAIGRLASYYQQFTTMRMLPGDVDAALTVKINSFEAAARQTFPDWDNFASPAQLALLDMIYNLGSLSGFPSLVAAANKKDWIKCAAECHRNGPSEIRNSETKARFESAAKEQPLPPLEAKVTALPKAAHP